jgi:hypothetical protein
MVRLDWSSEVTDATIRQPVKNNRFEPQIVLKTLQVQILCPGSSKKKYWYDVQVPTTLQTSNLAKGYDILIALLEGGKKMLDHGKVWTQI